MILSEEKLKDLLSLISCNINPQYRDENAYQMWIKHQKETYKSIEKYPNLVPLINKFSEDSRNTSKWEKESLGLLFNTFPPLQSNLRVYTSGSTTVQGVIKANINNIYNDTDTIIIDLTRGQKAIYIEKDNTILLPIEIKLKGGCAGLNGSYFTTTSYSSVCPAVNEVLNTICNTKLTQIDYRRMSKYREAFTKSLIDESGCYIGQINLEVSGEYSKSIYNWAIVYKDQLYSLKSCYDKISIAYLGLTIAPYTDRTKIAGQYLNFFSEGNAYSHANMLIFHQGNIKRIETNGSAEWDDVVDKTLSEYFHTKYPEYKYSNITPNCIGVQAVTGDEFCANWSMLLAYIVVKCNNPNIDQIHKQLSENGSYYLENLMNHWNCFMIKYIEDHKIFEAIIDADMKKLIKNIDDYNNAKSKGEDTSIIKSTIKYYKIAIGSHNPKYIKPEYQRILDTPIQ